MSAVFDGQISETKLLLEIVLQRNDIDVISSKSQYYLSNLQYREVRLDIYAKDSQNNAYHVEVQRDLRGASVRRARFTAALVDSKLLIKGQKFDELPERYTIFIAEDDIFGKGLPSYHAQNTIVELDNEILGDGGHIVYINGQKVGFNTYSRKYAIYGISVNQQEIKVARKITFNYDESTQSLQSLYGNKTNIYFYHNTTNNDCVVVMVNETSNRVVSVSYFNDFDKVSETLMLSFD
jgi:hypothetical protein